MKRNVCLQKVIDHGFYTYTVIKTTCVVKGPGDTLSETQKMWIETLAGFNIQVEVCHVKVWRGDDVLLNL